MPDKVRVGVVGVGHLGKHHARIYNELPESELIGLADVDQKNGRKIAAKLSTGYYSDYKELFGKVDAVNIATPTETHYEIAKDFLANGINVLVEKPITKEPEHAADLIKVAQENSCILQVGHIERFNGAIKQVRKHITDPKFIEVNRLSKFPERSLDIGVVLDLMIHDIDIILSFVNSKVKTVQAIGAAVLTKKEDIANARIEFENGCVANITASRISYKSERKFRVFEPSLYVSLDYGKQDFVIYKKKKPEISSPKDVERIVPHVEKTEPLREELMDFLSAIIEEKPPTVSGYHGLTALELALEITRQI